MSEVGAPRIVPAEHELSALPTPLNAGERAVLDALKQLGPEWHVFVQPRLAMAQPDFVAVHAVHGVWIIEVKDWNPAAYRADPQRRARWIEVFTGERWVQKVSPIKQVYAYQETFKDRFFVDHTGAWAPTDGLRVLLAMPQFSAEQATDLFGHFPLISGSDLPTLAARLESESESHLPPDRFEDLMRWLDEPENVSDQRLPLTLSRSAQRVANNPDGVRVRRVRGPAGSGKSLALASRAVALAGEGKSVLVVTFNITLMHYLHDLSARAARQRKVPAWQHSVSFTHFHGLLRDLAAQIGEHCQDGDDWEQWALNALGAAYRDGIADLPRYDAVLVDEGQDLEREWWVFLRSHLLREADGEMLLVADRTQNLFQRSNWTEESIRGGGFSGTWAELAGTYRMPVDLVPIVREYAQAFLPPGDLDLPTVEQDHPTLGEAHEPTRRRWLNVPDDDVVDAAADEVTRLIHGEDRLSPSDIVLLADHELGMQITEELRARGNDVFSVFAPYKSQARRRLKKAFWAGSPGIKGCTVHSFKGWESRAVVCVPSSRGELQLYIAMTRVKAAPSRPAFLTVVNSVDALRGFRLRFEREVLPSEVPALAGQRALDL